MHIVKSCLIFVSTTRLINNTKSTIMFASLFEKIDTRAKVMKCASDRYKYIAKNYGWRSWRKNWSEALKYAWSKYKIQKKAAATPVVMDAAKVMEFYNTNTASLYKARLCD